MPTLSTYITETRRVLHDANGTFWSDADLTSYINAGRKKICPDTACLRALETVTLTTSQETYTLSTLSTRGVRAIDVLNLTILWGAQRIPLRWMSWTQFNAYMRAWVTNENVPSVWSNFGVGPSMVIYVQQVPDQAYTAYLDYLYIPVDLVDDTTVDEIVWPYSDAVPYYAAYSAKFKEQNYGESAIFEQQYKQKAAWAISQTFTRRLPSAYDQGGGVGIGW